MRRKAGSLVPLELAICVAALELRRDGVDQFHGYEIARRLKDDGEARLLTAYGTLYRALERLEQMGLLTSTWEDPDAAAADNRPRRRLYTVTGAAETAVTDAERAARTAPRRRTRKGWAPA
jgi:DNA-binding PadR family transcriptional regulator